MARWTIDRNLGDALFGREEAPTGSPQVNKRASLFCSHRRCSCTGSARKCWTTRSGYADRLASGGSTTASLPPPKPGTINSRIGWRSSFTMVLIVESICWPVLRLVPLYQNIYRSDRTCFFIWCFSLIQDNGSAYIFDTVIRPCFECAASFRTDPLQKIIIY